MRLIDADSIHYTRVLSQQGLNMELAAKVVIDDMPTIDAAPVVHGRWIPKGDDDNDAGVYICSECGDERYFGEEVLSSEEAEHYCHYCPNCGAKMDEEVNKNADDE